MDNDMVLVEKSDLVELIKKHRSAYLSYLDNKSSTEHDDEPVTEPEIDTPQE